MHDNSQMTSMHACICVTIGMAICKTAVHCRQIMSSLGAVVCWL